MRRSRAWRHYHYARRFARPWSSRSRYTRWTCRSTTRSQIATPLAAHDDSAIRRLAQQKLEENRSQLRPLDPEMASFILIRTQQALIHRTAHDDPERLSNPRFADEVTELLVRYLEP